MIGRRELVTLGIANGLAASGCIVLAFVAASDHMAVFLVACAVPATVASWYALATAAVER